MQCGTSFLFKKNICKTPQSQQDLHSSLISENHSLEMSENSNKPKTTPYVLTHVSQHVCRFYKPLKI